MSSSFSFDAFDFTEFDETIEDIVLQNRQIDSMIDDVAFSIPTLSLQPTNHTIRATHRFIERQREMGHEGVFEQYFSDDPIYTPEIFRTRFRMRKSLFEQIMNKLVVTSRFFQQNRDATGRLGMSSIQKCTATIRVLAYGTGADLHDEYLKISSQTIRRSVEKFIEWVVSNFGDEYLKKPTEEDMAYLLHVSDQRGFPGSRNDINVLDQSPVFKDILEGRAPKAAFVKSISGPQIRKHQLFAQHQEAARKDVERAFGVLQAHFNFIKQPCLMWDRDMIGKVMLACIIMHNMIVEDERHTYLNYCDPTKFMEATRYNSQSGDAEENDDSNFEFSAERIASLSSYMRNRAQLRNRETHNALKNDLIEHIWQKFGRDD